MATIKRHPDVYLRSVAGQIREGENNYGAAELRDEAAVAVEAFGCSTMHGFSDVHLSLQTIWLCVRCALRKADWQFTICLTQGAPHVRAVIQRLR